MNLFSREFIQQIKDVYLEISDKEIIERFNITDVDLRNLKKKHKFPEKTTPFLTPKQQQWLKDNFNKLTVVDACCELEISPQSYYKWMKHLGLSRDIIIRKANGIK